MVDINNGNDLLIKGKEFYHNHKYEEALKYFEESSKLINDSSLPILMANCRKKIAAKENNKIPEPTETPNNLEDERECENIIQKKDYYDILGIKKDATEDEIKRAYRKSASKFHPDKNKSKHAEEAFKKVSHAFTTLKDPEKKQFYDKYGSEEEFREKYYQQNQQNQEEMDPFDLFFQMFTAGMEGNIHQRGGRVFRRQQRQNNEGGFPGNQYRRYLMIIQLFPFFLLLLYAILPYIFQTKKYQFFRDDEFYRRMTTQRNTIDYYIGEDFMNYYRTREMILGLEPEIEKNYLNYIGKACEQSLQEKQELENQLKMYRNNRKYSSIIESQLRGMNFRMCDRYNNLKKRLT